MLAEHISYDINMEEDKEDIQKTKPTTRVKRNGSVHIFTETNFVTLFFFFDLKIDSSKNTFSLYIH